jgi:hypothetical protein
MTDWNVRRILKELVDADRRRMILADFWRFADPQSRLAAQSFLARALHFRDVRIKQMPPEKKGELLAARIANAEAEPFLEAALMQHHVHRANALMAAFLDRWGVPHVDGAIEADDVTPPDEAKVRDAVAALAGQFDAGDVRLYLASVGLLMGDGWRQAAWPVVDEMMAAGAPAP